MNEPQKSGSSPPVLAGDNIMSSSKFNATLSPRKGLFVATTTGLPFETHFLTSYVTETVGRADGGTFPLLDQAWTGFTSPDQYRVIFGSPQVQRLFSGMRLVFIPRKLSSCHET
jgi:hypothetical protein